MPEVSAGVPSLAVGQVVGELIPRKEFSSDEILAFIERHTTLHKSVSLAYVVTGYQATVTFDDEEIVPPFEAPTVREALNGLMQGGDILTQEEAEHLRKAARIEPAGQ